MPAIEIPAIEIMPHWPQLIIQLVSLCLLFFVFKRFAWLPTKEYLSKRQAFLNGGFEEVEVAQKEAMALKDQYESQLAQAEEEALKIVETFREKGNQDYAELMMQTRVEMAEKLEKMNQALEIDKEKAHKEIKDNMLEIAVKGAEVLIKKEIDESVHEQLFADFIAKVGGEVE